MDYSGDFFEPYINQVNDDIACSKLIGLRHEYEKQLSDLIRQEQRQAKYERGTNEKISQSFDSHRKNLTEIYKQKAMEVAQPHMDAAMLEKIAKEHASEQDRNNPLTQSQSRMIEKIEEQKEKEALKQKEPGLSQGETPAIPEAQPEATPEKSARELAREQARAEILKQWERNSRNITKERGI